MTSLIGIKRYAPPAPPAAPKANSTQINDKRLKVFFETYAEELTVDTVRKKGDATHYSLAECPFHGGAHRDQKKAHKTDIIIDKNGARFKCFSDDCDANKFQDLLDLMEQRTGTRFDVVDDVELAERWGGIDDITQEPAGVQTPPVPAPAADVVRYVTDWEVMTALGGIRLSSEPYPDPG
jgi:hypothetical protein